MKTREATWQSLCPVSPPRTSGATRAIHLRFHCSSAQHRDHRLEGPPPTSPVSPAQPESAWMVSPCLGLGCCDPAPPSLTYPVHTHTHTHTHTHFAQKKEAPTAPSSPSANGTQKANAPPPQWAATRHTESLVCSPRGECHCTSAMSSELSRPTSWERCFGSRDLRRGILRTG